MKIGLLTSSRADFGIYYPLAKQLKEDPFFKLEIIAFGTHLSHQYGYTIDEITKQGFEAKHQIKTLPTSDSPKDISLAMGSTLSAFADFWAAQSFDLVLALGDRFEMFAAVSAASPFNINIAHIHAGETTLGAIDNAYRHSISLMSKYLFVSTDVYNSRACEISNKPQQTFTVGALSVDNLKQQKLLSIDEFNMAFNIDLSIPSILSTFHPETVSLEKNEESIEEILAAFKILEKDYQIIITMPNSDTMGLMIRKKISEYSLNNDRVKLIESFGMKGYLSCMKHCSFLLGNTSSGFVEAAFFPKWVINIGDRQKGRILTDNIISIEANKTNITETVKHIETSIITSECNIYGDGNASQNIVKKLKELANEIR